VDRGFIVRMTKRTNLRDDRSQTHPQIPYGRRTAFRKASPSGGGLVELVRRENEKEGGKIEEKKRGSPNIYPGIYDYTTKIPLGRVPNGYCIVAHFVGRSSIRLDREVSGSLGHRALSKKPNSSSSPPLTRAPAGTSNSMMTIDTETRQTPDVS